MPISSYGKNLLRLTHSSFIVMACIHLATPATTYADVNNNVNQLIKAEQAILMDADTGTILLAKNKDDAIAPASLTKMMTALLVFEALNNGSVTLTDQFTVSVKAWKTQGSRMFLEPDSKVSVLELLRGIIVQSGNDAAVALAEGLYLDEAQFVKKMNQKAQDLNLTHSHFKNSTGLNEKGHVSTVHDMAKLAQSTINDFPYYYVFYKERSFTHNDITQSNRNQLLFSYEGADGLKTGYVAQSGYSLAASARRGHRRLISVVSGTQSKDMRNQESEKLLDWGFRHFSNYQLATQKNDIIVTLPVWGGAQDTIALSLASPLLLTIKRDEVKQSHLEITYDAPLDAPIHKGEVLALLTLTLQDGRIITRNLVAQHEVKGGFILWRPIRLMRAWLK